MKRLPVGIQTFRDIVQNDYLYVDKTDKIFDLVNNPKGVYFLSRPRRFGKSLLISTLNEIFEGEKELFKDLWIYKADCAWKKHPVVRIDFSRKKAESKDDLKGFILHQLKNIAGKYWISLKHDQYDEAFDELLTKLSEINKVVVLIDEYDKPIIDNIENKELAIELREILKGFYTIIKAWKLIDALREHDFELFFDTLRIFFADISYDLHISKEKYYQTIFYLIFSLIGLNVEAEVRTNKGRIDAVIIDKDIYIFEFKFDGDKDNALKQIRDKKYFEKYQGVGREIYLFGVEFTDRNIGDWVLEKL